VEGEVMPAKDKFHDVVLRALQNDGWTILKEQVRIIVDKRRLWIDVKAKHEVQNEIVLIEIKSFDSPDSEVKYLENVLGQYLLYRAIIQDIEWSEELYLAIPKTAFDSIFSENLGLLVRRVYGIKLLVIDENKEEILQWIP
jgi:hypothetical protein